MPAFFSVFWKIADTKVSPVVLYESADKSSSVYRREWSVYDSSNSKTAKVIGSLISVYEATTTANDQRSVVSSFFKFFENSGLPYGDDNILVAETTLYNKYVNGVRADGLYTHPVNQSLSSGEYANQVGYATYVKDSSKVFAEFTFNFPLPVVTYTNVFNSLPQPSTAPLPA